jgi:hypothetical protein
MSHSHIQQGRLYVRARVAPWILFSTLDGIMDGTSIYCSDRSAVTPPLNVSWTRSLRLTGFSM